MGNSSVAYLFVGFFGLAVFLILMIRNFVFVSDLTLLLLELQAYSSYFVILAVSIVFIGLGIYKARRARKEGHVM